MSIDGVGPDERALHAYHDGELGWLARWRFERRLAREPGLRQELSELESLGRLAREAEAEAPGPDLWQDIARQLPSLDAERLEAATGGSWLPMPVLRPVAAAAAVAVVAFALVFGLGRGETEAIGVVRWVDPGPHDVLVLEDEENDATIIWVLDGPSEVSRGEGRGVA